MEKYEQAKLDNEAARVTNKEAELEIFKDRLIEQYASEPSIYKSISPKSVLKLNRPDTQVASRRVHFENV